MTIRTMVATAVAVTTAAAVGSGGVAVAGVGEAHAQASKRKCHKSYRGRCLKPNASDYDCIGGSGNGPYYTGWVRVVGPDVFRLDSDRDGIGCE